MSGQGDQENRSHGSPRPYRSPSANRKPKHNKRVTFAAKRMLRRDHSDRGDEKDNFHSPSLYHLNRVRVKAERNISKVLEKKKIEIARNTPLKVTKVVEEDDDGTIKLPANYKRKKWVSTEDKKEDEDKKDEWENASFHDVDPSEKKGGKKRTRKARKSKKPLKNKSGRVHLR